jgi:hypothetical protein
MKQAYTKGERENEKESIFAMSFDLWFVALFRRSAFGDNGFRRERDIFTSLAITCTFCSSGKSYWYPLLP